MKSATAIAYRRLTAADFFNISKPADHHNKTGGKPGGGQSYIDFAGTDTPLSKWEKFFDAAIPKQGQKGGPAWDIDIFSLGIGTPQKVRIATRSQNGKFRNVQVTSQKIHSKKANRILAWHPLHSNFPELPPNITTSEDQKVKTIVDEGLYVFIIKTDNKEYWAGFLKKSVDGGKNFNQLETLFTGETGLIELTKPIDFDETSGFPAFKAVKQKEPDAKAEKSKPTEKPAPTAKKKSKPKKEASFTDLLFEDDLTDESVQVKEVTQKVRKRNKKAVTKLKQLYKTCQITGDKFVFAKNDGEPYLEAHHLIPLGEGGADNPSNLVVISAHAHRMLHYADVSEIDLKKIKDNKLPITINGEEYEITWNPEHIEVIESYNSSEEESGSPDSE